MGDFALCAQSYTYGYASFYVCDKEPLILVLPLAIVQSFVNSTGKKFPGTLDGNRTHNHVYSSAGALAKRSSVSDSNPDD